MTKMRMLIVGAWAAVTRVTIGEDLLKGHSWTTGVVLLITVGVGLLNCRVLYTIRTRQLEMYK